MYPAWFCNLSSNSRGTISVWTYRLVHAEQNPLEQHIENPHASRELWAESKIGLVNLFGNQVMNANDIYSATCIHTFVHHTDLAHTHIIGDSLMMESSLVPRPSCPSVCHLQY